ncbi:hypothetical protein KBC70_02655 [Candidatus Woesebacteria bacterium]|nr:hypothetical protein [Candidatus Woesebacteria bacterium]
MKNSYLTIAAVSAGLIALAYLQFARQESVNPQDALKPTPAVADANVTPPTEADTKLQNGVYEAVGDYTSPAGEEHVGVKITLENGVVTASEFTPQATNEISVKMQGKFKDAYQQDVVGKPLSTIDLGVVGGSSLTPIGFEDALKKIMIQAQG